LGGSHLDYARNLPFAACVTVMERPPLILRSS